jgi:hypothetical protein
MGLLACFVPPVRSAAHCVSTRQSTKYSARAAYRAGGGLSPDCSTFCVLVTFVSPPGVEVVVVVFVSELFSQPTTSGATQLKARQKARNRFI